MDILKERYKNRRQMVSTYVNYIVKYKKLSGGSAEEIIKFHDCIQTCLTGLKNLKYNVSAWDPIIVSIAMDKFDKDTNKAFEESILDVTEVPTLKELLRFLLKRYCILRASTKEQKSAAKDSKQRSFHVTSDNTQSCSKCKKGHPLTKCEEFKKLNPFERKQHAKEHNICFNCLSHTKDSECRSTKTCFTCRQKHHTLLHFDKKTPTKSKNLHAQSSSTQDASVEEEDEPLAMYAATSSIILPTAVIKIQDKHGLWQTFRALLDTGSSDTFISENAAQSLKLPRQKVATNIKGIGEMSAGTCKSTLGITLAPRFQTNQRWHTTALVMPKLSSFLLTKPLHTSFNLHKTEKLTLADPKFNTPGRVDIILGANIYAQIIKKEIKRDKDGLVAQNTELGWIILGRSNQTTTSKDTVSMMSLAEIDQNLRTFWEMDVGTNEVQEQEEECEKYYKDTHLRQKDGRYQVRLPFKSELTLSLGDSRRQALARFLSMEKKFAQNSALQTEYVTFMNEYQALGHMSHVKNYSGPTENVFYLPHHAVLKTESTTTKTRVVFDASCRTSSGVSLNNMLHAGPKLQQDLPDILTRWRKYSIVYTADIEKMFRQIQLHEEDRDFHRILWRENPREPIQEYQLNTVTYGTAPAPFLSVRTLQQLAKDEGHQYPKAAKVLIEDFYVDDMLTGAHTIEEARMLYKEIQDLMALGKFNLRKWTSNSRELIEEIHEDLREKGIVTSGGKTPSMHCSFCFAPNSPPLSLCLLAGAIFVERNPPIVSVL
ncbi:uncharacterized protein LOC129809145 [Phlebotomus papatasi]|uniref:uncharacterized protein LOC129809145 n=1 Tax=Phlebotomus papatasi TaxID=29031 RepID=UPI002483F5E0|nr:uncharacterized protein LOC129809145 [Phlebotomus papatasi]